MGPRHRHRNGRRQSSAGGAVRPVLPKLCGADVELGNFILGAQRHSGNDDSCREASQALLREIEGLPLVSPRHATGCACSACRESWPASWSAVYPGGSPSSTEIVYDPQDWGRKFLSGNGGCVYVDLNHLEVCLPEVLGAHDHVAAWHAMLRIARRALQAANARRPRGESVQVLVANSDGFGHSYGSHLNFLISRRAWDNLFVRKLHHLLTLATYQASSIVFTGQGKVGSENGAPPVAFQLSQRADFFETLVSEATTCRRPIVNSRDEPLCGRPGSAARRRDDRIEPARLHVIFHDSTLSHVATFLKVGVMQIVLAMLEAEAIRPDLLLDDPLQALRCWSHDPTLRATARTISGGQLTAIEVQRLFLNEAQRFADGGGCDGIVPEYRTILELWDDTLTKLESGDLVALAGRLDWALKLVVLRRAMTQRRLNWGAPEIKHLDLAFGNLDAGAGLYWAYERAGLVERLVPEESIARFIDNPPEDTRAWTRAMLLRRAGGAGVDDVDWDRIRVRTGKGSGYRTVDLDDPLGATRQATGAIFDRASTLDALLDGLGADHEDIANHGAGVNHRPTEAGPYPAMTTGRPDEGRTDGGGGRNGHEIS